MWPSNWLCVVLALATLSSAEDTRISRDCGDDPCLNGGDCYFDYEMEEEDGDRFFCVCVEPFYGKTCEKGKLSTTSEPIETTTTFVSTQTSNKYHLTTATSTWDRATDDAGTGISRDCGDDPCLNGGDCYFDYEMEEEEGDRFFCICVEPFYGHTCEKTKLSTSRKPDETTTTLSSTVTIPDLTTAEGPCSYNPCQNGGFCQVQGPTFKCFCPSPFTGRTCSSGPCSNSPCKNGGFCAVDGDSHACSCKNPFTGKNCEITPCSNNPCENDGVCKIVGNSFTCSCNAPFFGLRCEQDACSKNPCKNGGMCKATDDGYKCYCSSPFMGSHCEKTPCSGSPCENNGICAVEGDNYRCSCPSPYSGKSCEIGPCTGNPCMNEGMCEIRGDSFECYCKKPYYGERCQKDPCTPNPCRNDGTCEVNGSSFTCTCKEPFIGELCGEMLITSTELEETTTPKPDACSNNPCKNGGMCKATDDGYNCYCLSPFTGSHCERSPCTVNPCMNEGKCQVRGDSFECFCKKPYHGETCQKGEILTTSTSPRTELEETTAVPTPNPDPCSLSPCRNGGTCRLTEDSYVCDCPEEFVGRQCQTACNCKNGKCIATEKGTAECVCNPGFGKHPKAYCEACNCGEQFSCTFQDVWFMIQKTCICPGNYKEVNGKCYDQCSLKPCQNGGTCTLTEDSYRCECSKEFIGDRCQTEKCKCENGKCIESEKGPKCVCNSDYGMFSPGVCKACNCGKNFTCTFKEDIFQFRLITYCMCPEGYSRLGPQCIQNKKL